jgi:dihydroorotate dehydrogenase electron transfer subunit
MRADRLARLVNRQRLSRTHVLLSFRHPEIAQAARPGQFAMIKAGHSAAPPVRRPFSIMSVDPGEETFTVFIKALGPGSRALSEMSPGDRAQCLGPLGRAFSEPVAGSEALLVAGGYGIAPFVFLCGELEARRIPTRVYYGGRSANELALREPFERMGVGLELTTEDGSLGSRGLVTEPLRVHLDRRSGAVRLFACGPHPMLRTVARLAERHGVPAEVSLDPWMGCGLGTCLGCVVRIREPGEDRPHYRRACSEGPVFDASTVVWTDEPSLPGAEGRP